MTELKKDRSSLDLILLEKLGNTWKNQSAVKLSEISGNFDYAQPIQQNFNSASVSVRSIEPKKIEYSIKPVSGFSFSVVIPTFSPVLTELRECLISVVGAARQVRAENFEIILVDDCSTHPELIASCIASLRAELKLNETQLYINRNEVNQGPSSSRNRGFEKTRYNFVFFVDSDDLIHPWYFNLLGAELILGADVSTSGMFLSTGTVFCASDRSLKEILKENGNGCGIGIRKDGKVSELLKYRSLYNDKNHFHYEDWELNIALHLFSCNIRVIPIPLYFYRIKTSGRNLSNAHLHLYSHIKAPLHAISSVKKADISIDGKDLIPFIELTANVALRSIHPETPGSLKQKFRILKQIVLNIDTLISYRRPLHTLVKHIYLFVKGRDLESDKVIPYDAEE